eukprot:3848482-Pyramimonas_sp.AAC.1
MATTSLAVVLARMAYRPQGGGGRKRPEAANSCGNFLRSMLSVGQEGMNTVVLYPTLDVQLTECGDISTASGTPCVFGVLRGE